MQHLARLLGRHQTTPHPAPGIRVWRPRPRRLLTLVVVTIACFAVVGSAQAAYAPVEPFARYDPQSTCSPKVKAGTKTLGKWIVASYRGGYGSTSRPCRGGSVSEHKEGRAFDWRLNGRSKTDRARAARFLKRITATGPTGEQAELARRMGVMYLIWSDRIYASYDGFRPRVYRSSSCRGKKLRKCSKTLRHLDHMHISLSRAGSKAQTSFYTARSGRVR
jgi:hypothetical protein